MPRKKQTETAKVAHSKSGDKKAASASKKPAQGRKPKGKAKAETKGKAAPAAFLTGDANESAAAEVEKIITRYRGRPTKYDPAYCEMVICWGRLGKSKTWMAAELMVVRETLDDWAKANPEFSDALALAKQLEQQHWEDQGHNGLTTMGFQGSVWNRSMAARFPKDWREQKQIDHGVTDALAALLGEIDGDGASLI